MRHHIIVKWNSLVADKNAIAAEVTALFQKAASIDDIRKIEVFQNVVDRPNRYDLMICIEMKKSALQAYDESVWHKEWKSKYGKFVESKAIFDSE